MYSVNIFIIPVDSRRSCVLRSSLNLVNHVWTQICSHFINTPPSSFRPWNVWPTLMILMWRVMGGYHRPVGTVEVSLSFFTEIRLNVYVPLSLYAIA
jgi:hypothetical protein